MCAQGVPQGPPQIAINVTKVYLFLRFCVKMAPWKVLDPTWTSLGLYFGHMFIDV